MGYDFEVWSQNKFNLSKIDLGDKWTLKENSILFESKNWQIVCDINQKIELEDIPDNINPLIPSISYLHNISVEPISAPKVASTKAKQLIKLLRNTTIGASLDQQTEEILLPTGYKKLKVLKQKKDKRINILNMVWYMKELPFKSKEELTSFILTIKKLIPEALPKRYGDYEPPQYKLHEQGLEHFIDFLSNDLFGDNFSSIVWYPKKPIVGALLDSGEISSRIGARFPIFELEFDDSILNDKAWDIQLKRIWKEISFILNPFYGEVRILKNAIASRTTYYCDFKTESHPTRSGFWMGIPKNLGLAIVLGKEYLNVWDDFDNNAEYQNDLLFCECNEWNVTNNLSQIIGTPPSKISQKFIPQQRELKTGGSTMFWNIDFPEYWPFKHITDKLKIKHLYVDDDFKCVNENKTKRGKFWGQILKFFA